MDLSKFGSRSRTHGGGYGHGLDRGGIDQISSSNGHNHTPGKAGLLSGVQSMQAEIHDGLKIGDEIDAQLELLGVEVNINIGARVVMILTLLHSPAFSFGEFSRFHPVRWFVQLRLIPFNMASLLCRI